MGRRTLLGVALLAALLGVAWLYRDGWEWMRPDEPCEPVNPVRTARRAGHLQLRLGDALFDQRRFDQARVAYERAAALYAESVHDYNTAIALDRLGDAEYRLGRMEAAADHYRQALEIFERVRERKPQIRTNESLGDIAFNLGQYGQARTYYGNASAIAREAGERGVLMLMLVKQGDTERAAKAYSAADAYYDEVISEPSAEPRAKAFALEGRVRIADAQGRRQEAIRLAEVAWQAAQRVDDPGAQGKMLLLYGAVLANAGRHPEARDHFAQAVRLYAKADEPGKYAYALSRLAAAELTAGDRAAARRTFGDAARAYDDAGDASQGRSLRRVAEALAQP